MNETQANANGASATALQAAKDEVAALHAPAKVAPTPTKVPVEPIPTFEVDNPIRLSFIFATKRGTSSSSKVS